MRKTGIDFFLLLMLIWVGACSEDSPEEPEDPSIWIPAVQLSGVGSDRIEAVEITDGVGYCDIEGNRIPTLVFKAQYWDAYGLTVFHAIAPTSSELHVLYFYSAADTLRTIWHESYTNPLISESASGASAYDGQGISSTPELLCLSTVPEGDQLVSGLTISGSELTWSSGSGTIEIDDQIYGLFPFQLVDCRECGANPDDGWYEVHAVFRGPRDEMEFGILYLFVDDPGRVSLYYRIQLCDLKLGTDARFDADWTLEIDVEKRVSWVVWPPVGR